MDGDTLLIGAFGTSVAMLVLLIAATSLSPLFAPRNGLPRRPATAPPPVGWPARPPQVGAPFSPPPGPPFYPPGVPTHPPATPQRRDRSAEARRADLYPNILLGVACLLVVAAAIVFAGVSQSPVLRAVCLWAVAVVSYTTGLLLHGLSRRLRPVGVALVGLGLVLVPIAAGLLGGLGLTSGRLTWFICSLVGMVCYALAAYRLQSALVTWLGVLFGMSFVLSGVGLTTAGIIWYFAALVLAATIAAAIGAVLRGRTDQKFVLPYLLLGQVLAPATLVAAWVTPAAYDTQWSWVVLFGLLGLHYGVAWLLLRGAWRLSAGSVAVSLCLMAIPRAVETFIPQGSPFAFDAAPTAVASVAGLVPATIAYLVSLTWSRPTGAPTMQVSRFAWCFGTAVAIHILAVCRIWAIPYADAWSRPLAIAHTVVQCVIVALALLIAWRRDLPCARGVAVCTGVAAALIVPTAGFGTADDQAFPASAAVFVLIATLLLVLTADVIATSVVMSRRGVGRRRLRSAAAVLTPVHAVALLMPTVFLPAARYPYAVAVALFIVLVALCVVAYFVRSAPIVVAGMPLVFAIASCAGGGWRTGQSTGTGNSTGFGAAATHGATITPIVSLVLCIMIVCGLAVAQLRLMAAGRYRRALAAAVTLCVYGLPFFGAQGLVATVAGPDRTWHAGALGVACALGIVLLVSVMELQTHRAGVPPGGSRLRSSLVTARIGVACIAGLVLAHGFAHWAVGPAWLAITSLFIVAAVTTWLALARGQLVVLAAVPAVFQLAVRAFATVVDDGVFVFILAAWVTWACTYGIYWLRVRLRRDTLTPLISAFVLAALAILLTPALDVHVSWLHSLPQLVSGVSTVIPALMLVLLAGRLAPGTARRVVGELATYVGAAGLMLALHGIVAVLPAAYWHLAVGACWLWAVRVTRRGGSVASARLRLIAPMALLTVLGMVAAITDGGWYSVLFLADHVGLLILGAVRTRPWALWWGLAASVAGVLWFLRDLVWAALLVLALVIIGVVVWLLIRGTGKSPARRGRGPVTQTPPPPPGPGMAAPVQTWPQPAQPGSWSPPIQPTHPGAQGVHWGIPPQPAQSAPPGPWGRPPQPPQSAQPGPPGPPGPWGAPPRPGVPIAPPQQHAPGAQQQPPAPQNTQDESDT